MLAKIKEMSQDGLVVCPVGVGSAFAKKNFNSSFIVAKNGYTLLVDCGATVPYALSQQGIKVTDFDGYAITHLHADHIGGVEELLLMSRYVTKEKPLIYISQFMQHSLWSCLEEGVSKSEYPNLKIDDVADWRIPYKIRMERGPEFSIPSTSNFSPDSTLGPLNLLFLKTIHCPAKETVKPDNIPDFKFYMKSNALKINQVFISGDTQFNKSHIEDASTFSQLMFQDCQLFNPGSVHASYDELKTLDDKIKNKMYLYHYGDNFEDFHPEDDGFKGFARPWEIYSVGS